MRYIILSIIDPACQGPLHPAQLDLWRRLDYHDLELTYTEVHVNMPYEYLDHQADLGIRGIGKTPQEAFSEGAQAMLAAMANVDLVDPTTEFVQRCSAPDAPTLFVEWLNELLYQREVNDMLFASAQVTHMENSETEWVLEGIAKGEPLDLDCHEIYTEVKAATYAGLDYRKERDLWIVQCVIDL